MSKRVFLKPYLFPIYAIIGVLSVFVIYNVLTPNTQLLEEVTPENSQKEVVEETKPVVSKPTVKQNKSLTETVKDLRHVEKSEIVTETRQENDPDWATQKPVVKVHTKDPFKDHSELEQAKKDGSWIGDPEKMDPADLVKAIRQQMVNRFGDTPEVHAMMDFQEKKMQGITLTLDEKITGQKALASVFPSETNRKTLAFYEWMRTKGTEYKNEFTVTDVEELRALGIDVKAEPAAGGGVNITFNTK